MSVQGNAQAVLPPRKNRYPFERRLGLFPETFWTGAINLAPTRIGSPERPARRESLHRLSYPDSQFIV